MSRFPFLMTARMFRIELRACYIPYFIFLNAIRSPPPIYIDITMLKNLLLPTSLVAAFCVCWSMTTRAQDIHWTQFYNSPMWLDPSLTGPSDADLRVAAQYRTQWGSVTVPYNTMALMSDYSLKVGANSDDQVGIGFSLMNDEAGDGHLRNTQAHISCAYHKSLGADATSSISFGVQAGVIQRSVDFSKLYFDNQYTGDGFDLNASSRESFDRLNYIVPDVSAGLSYFNASADNFDYYIGGSLFHLNEPNMSFTKEVTEPLYRRVNLYGGMDFYINESFSIGPRAVYFAQGPHSEFNIGAVARFSFGSNPFDDNPNAFSIGATYRAADAGVLMTRFDYGPIALGLSYDVNASKLVRVSTYQGGPEIYIIYKASWTDRSNNGRDYRRSRSAHCPTF